MVLYIQCVKAKERMTTYSNEDTIVGSDLSEAKIGLELDFLTSLPLIHLGKIKLCLMTVSVVVCQCQSVSVSLSVLVCQY